MQRQIAILVEEQELAEKQMKNEGLSELKAYWDQQASMPKNQMSKMANAPVDPDRCSLGALQSFAGEDASAQLRSRMQAQQMRSWTTQQMAEKQAQNHQTAEDEARFAEYMQMVDEKRVELENEERDGRRAYLRENAFINATSAKDKHQTRVSGQAALQAANQAEIAAMLADPMLCEDTSVAKSAVADTRVRRDHFKGFSKAQTKMFYKENEQGLQAKMQKRADDSDALAQYATEQELLLKMLEEQELVASSDARDGRLEQRHFLEEQRAQEMARRSDERTGRFGGISSGLFDGFGCSHR